MPASQGRAKEVTTYLQHHSMEETCNKFNISRSTARRYRRQATGDEKEISAPKILLFDLETSPMECYTWGIHKRHIGEHKIKKDSAMLSWAGKWLMEDKIFSWRVDPDQAHKRDDKEICVKLREMLDRADIAIAHNLKGFDKKYANTRFILNNLDPPSPYNVVDTYRAAKKSFRFPSNRLSYLSYLLTDEEKMDTSFDLWKECVDGDSEEALDNMMTYNQQDVRALEEVYLQLRPWITSHPNLGLYFDDISNRCPNCGSQELDPQGYYYTPAGKYQSLKCTKCGAYGRERKQDLTAEERENLRRSRAH